MLNQFDSYESFLMDKAALKKVPVSGTFELLPYCNMSCEMCYIQENPTLEKLNKLNKPDFWLDVIKQGIEQGLLNVLFTGGEFFLYPWYKELYEAAHKLPIYLIINTNATMLDEEKVKWLAKYPPKRLNISLYGTSDETYNKICHNPKGFTQVIKAFDLLKKYDIDFRVHTTLVPDNVDEYYEFVRICNEYRVPLQMVSYMYPSYRKNSIFGQNDGRLSAKDAAYYRFKYTKDGCVDVNHFYNYAENMINIVDNYEKYELYKSTGMTCRGGLSTFWINWKGEMSACGIMNQKVNDLKIMSFVDAWKNTRESYDSFHLSEKCANCSKRVVCQICAAAAYCETGKSDGISKYYCDMTDEYERLLREVVNERKNRL